MCKLYPNRSSQAICWLISNNEYQRESVTGLINRFNNKTLRWGVNPSLSYG